MVDVCDFGEEEMDLLTEEIVSGHPGSGRHGVMPASQSV
jgi:hypothetical protein